MGCSKEPQIDSSSELVAIDFVCDEITTRADDGDSYMFTLVGAGNSGKPVSDKYSYVEGKLTSTSKMLAADKATYRLVIASPATEMEAIPDTSTYGYKIVRELPSAVQPYINTTPISVAVWGITAGSQYIYELNNVKLQEQRSKVKVQLQVPENDSRTITKLYYSNLYDTAYTCPYLGVLYGNNKPNNSAYEFDAFPTDGTGSKVYTNTEPIVEPTISGEGVTYFISGDYSTNTPPQLFIGLWQDDEERLIEMGLNIKMDPMTTYTYNIKISSTELTVRVYTDVWDSVNDNADIEGEIGEPIDSFKINIATGVVSDWVPGCVEDDGNSDIEQPDVPAEIVVDYTNEEIYKSSNCYILNPSENGTMVYYIPVKRIDEFWGDPDYVANGTKNTLSSVDDKWEAVIFWHDFSNYKSADAISKLRVEKSVSPNTGKAAVKVTLPKEFHDDPLNHCNVGYLVRKTDTKEVLWSWHLWITDYNPYKTLKDGVEYSENKFGVISGELHRYNSDIFINGIYKDKKIMDRNIGARSLGNGELESFGSLYYQYGRKDPLPVVALYANGYVYGSNSTPQSFEYSVNNPEKFIIKSGNWCNSDAAQSTDYIWNDCKIKKESYTSGKSIFDPSPLGFRVPINGTWSDFNKDTFKSGIFGIGYDYKYYAPYPTQGCRIAYSGKFGYEDNGYSWSATPASNMNGYSFNFGPTIISVSTNNNRAYGYCVRPIEE